MPAYKNKETGTWYVMTQYTDWTGARKQKCKRGFDTRREALEWEQKFQQQSAGDLDMSFEALHHRSQSKAEREYLADQGAYHPDQDRPVFRQAQDQRDHHQGCDCVAERAACLP